MKKVLSVLLAVCLFATLLVPAFAYGTPDFGKLADVKKVEFDKTQYDLGDILKDKDGASEALWVDVTDLLTMWDSNGNRTNFDADGVSESEIRAYWSSNNEVLAVDETTGKVTKIMNKKATDVKVTLRVTMASGAQASTTIVVPANVSTGDKDAYGYRLANIELEEGKFIENFINHAKLTWTAPKLTAQTTININGTGVAVAAGDAAAVAEAVRTNWATLNIKGVEYTAKAKTSATDAVVVWETAVTGALDAGFVPAEGDLKVTGVPSAKGTITETVPGDDVNVTTPAAKATYTSVVTVAPAFVAGDTITIGGIAYTVIADAGGTTAGTNVTVTDATATFVADKYAANATDADYDITAAAGTITFTAKNAGAIAGDGPAAAPTVPTFTATGTGAATAAAATNTVPGVDEVSTAAVAEEFTFEPVAMAGNKALKLGETTFAFLGNETAEMVVTALDGKKATIQGVVYTLAKTNATTITGTADVAGAVTAPSNTDIVLGGAGDSKLAFSNGNNEGAGNPYVYNIGDEITPILSSYKFTGDQKAGFTFAVRSTTSGTNSHKVTLKKGETVDLYGVKFLVSEDADGYPELLIGEGTKFDTYKGTFVYVRVLNDKFSNAQQEKEFSIKLVGAAGEKDLILPAESYVGVGKTLDLRTLSKSVEDTKNYWTVEPYGNYQTEKEAGMIAKIVIETMDGDNRSYGWTVKGLAPGVVTIKLRKADGTLIDSMKLNVGTGSVAAPTPSTANATVKVNEQVKLSVKNLNSDEYVKWSIDNNNVSLGNYDGAAATVYGKKEGTAVVTAKVYESKKAAEDDKDPINTFKINVTVKAAESKPVTTPGTTAPTTNPQTGDSIFANLIF